jgi:FkbM family methyltransferase
MLRELRKSEINFIRHIIAYIPVPTFVKQFYRKYKVAVGKRHPIQNTKTSKKYSLERLGTEYGGWVFVDNAELYNSPIISAGLGEDASFDLEFAQKYNSTVIIVDPTPRAIKHFEEIEQSFDSQKIKPYTQNSDGTVIEYDLLNINKSQLSLIPKVLWNEQTELEFYKPEIDSHVSHSIVNWQHDYSNDTEYIEVQADPITSIVNEQNINTDDIHLIKLDIEGAEIEVIEQMMDCGFTPRQILVEFDELHNPSNTAFERVDKAHNLLVQKGYELLYSDGFADFLYYRGDN